MYFQCNIHSSLYRAVHCFCSQVSKVFWFFFGGDWWVIQAVLYSWKLSVLCISSPTFPCSFPLLCNQLRGSNLLLIQTLYLIHALLGWARTMVSVLGSMECRGALCEARIQDTHCILAWKSNAKHWIEFLETLVLLEHLVLQLCSDSHQGHSFFSKLWVGSPVWSWYL